MRNSIIILFLLSLLACEKSTKKEVEVSETDIAKPEYNKTEIITSSYSVKTENLRFVKDTVNMTQSIIVDKDGTELASIYYDLDGTVSWRDEYQYDTLNRKVGSKYFEGGVQKSYYEYDLDSAGRRLGYRAKEVSTDTLIYDGISRYEKGGLMRKDGYLTQTGKFVWNYEYYFDDNGQELGYAFISPSTGRKFPVSYQYVDFNDDGKWIERNLVENDTIISIEVREFKGID